MSLARGFCEPAHLSTGNLPGPQVQNTVLTSSGWGTTSHKSTPLRRLSAWCLISLELNGSSVATAKVPTRHLPADPKCQSWLPAQHSPVPCPCCLIDPGRYLYHYTSWLSRNTWLHRKDECRGLEKGDSLIHSLTNSFTHSLTWPLAPSMVVFLKA